jgi:hypothetical protein
MSKMKELATKDLTTHELETTMTEKRQLAPLHTVANRLLAAADEAGAQDKMLKFSKGKYFKDGEEEVPVGSEFTVLIEDAAVGWTRIPLSNEKVERRIGRLFDGYVAESREALGDLDESKWPVDSLGKPKDPWFKERFLPLVNEETGEAAVFRGGSIGAQRAVGNVLRMCGRNLHKGKPIVALGVREYKHPQYGRIASPDFKVVGWEKQPTLAAEMNDTIPF